MIAIILAAAALAADPWAGQNSDIQTERTIPIPAEILYDQLTTTAKLQQVFPDDCLEDWIHGTKAEGPARVTYDILAWQRRLTATVNAKERGRLLEIDNAGKGGFLTRFLFEEVDAGTQVTLTTYINAPPWPIRKYFWEAVRPEWKVCYDRTLETLETRAAAGWSKPPEVPRPPAEVQPEVAAPDTVEVPPAPVEQLTTEPTEAPQ